MKCRAFIAGVALVVVTACSGSTSAQQQSTDSDAVATTCDASTPIVGDEVQGVSADASIYGLLFLTHQPPIRVGDDVKIVWRMTGTGDLAVRFESSTGHPGVLSFGPEPHSGSTYSRPGAEWGTGFLFDEAGCWHIHLQRTSGSGDVWIDVADA